MQQELVGTSRFPRPLQWDTYTCAPRSIHAICRHFGVDTTYAEVRRALRPVPVYGTTVRPMLAFMRGTAGLRVGYRPRMTFPELLRALNRGGVVLAHLDGDHVGVVHAADRERVWLADPSLIRTPLRTISRKRFLERWTRWGLVVSKRPSSKHQS